MPHPDKPVILVTGSEGLIGDAIVQALSSRYRVAGFDIARLPHKDPAKLDFIDCDFTSDESVTKALAELRRREGNRLVSVIHLAAYYNFSGEPSPLYKQLTYDGTRRLLRGLHDFEVEQFIFASTHLVTQPSEDGEPVTEETPLDPDAWSYPRSKIDTERLIRAEHGKIPAVVLRVSGVYNEDTHTVPIAQQMNRIAGKDLESYLFPGDPDSGQAFVHLEDTVDLIDCAIERRHQLEPYEVFLVAEPDKMSYSELQDSLGELIHGKEWPTIRIPKVVAKVGAWAQGKIAAEGEVFIKPWMVDLADDDYPVSVEHAREKLGWNPRHRLRDTLPAMVRRMQLEPRRWYEVNGLDLPVSQGGGEREVAEAGAAVAALPSLDVAAPPYDYNPSSWSQRIPLCILAAVAFLASSYMALYEWKLIDSVWDPVFGGSTQRVLDSDVSHMLYRWFGIPDAALGAIAYLSDAVFALAGSTRRWQYRPWLVVLFGLDVIPLGIVSSILVVLQGTVVGSWCFLCLVTAAVSLLLAYWAYDEVWASVTYLHRVWKKTGSVSILWDTFIGRPRPEAEAVALVREVK